MVKSGNKSKQLGTKQNKWIQVDTSRNRSVQYKYYKHKYYKYNFLQNIKYPEVQNIQYPEVQNIQYPEVQNIQKFPGNLKFFSCFYKKKLRIFFMFLEKKT